MRDKMQKKIQHKVNRDVRRLNKMIEEDELWQGRFYAHQTNYAWWHFEDNSGGILRIELEYVDKKTNRSKKEYYSCLGVDRFFYSDIFMGMNDFVNDCILEEKNNSGNIERWEISC